MISGGLRSPCPQVRLEGLMHPSKLRHFREGSHSNFYGSVDTGTQVAILLGHVQGGGTQIQLMGFGQDSQWRKETNIIYRMGSFGLILSIIVSTTECINEILYILTLPCP